MADKSGIEWTDATWNPVVGCSIVSPGCTNCYAMGQAARIIRCSEGSGRPTHYAGTVEAVKGKPVWTGKLALAPDHILTQPLRWTKGRRIFVNSMGDLFHDDVPDAWIDRVFAVMALTPQHTYQILTKRADRMRAYLTHIDQEPALDTARRVSRAWPGPRVPVPASGITFPLGNVWLGVSAEDQRRADERIPDLLATPAAIRFVSAEPLLGPIDLMKSWELKHGELRPAFPALDWIIVGGESGKGARPMHPDWARSIRNQCAADGTAFFFKQWGEWGPDGTFSTMAGGPFRSGRLFEEPLVTGLYRATSTVEDGIAEGATLIRMGKARAGRLLDGVTHDAMPELRHA